MYHYPTYEPLGGPHSCNASHHLVADHNGEPACCCGWNPAAHPSVKSRAQAITAIGAHRANFTPASDA